MKKVLQVLLNGETVIELDRTITIPEEQLLYLDNMDARMQGGIQLGDEFITTSTQLQKAQYVTNLLVNSLLNNDSNQANAMITYLSVRLPKLHQVICTGKEEEKGIQIKFIYENDSNNEQNKPQEQTIKFFDAKKYMKQ